MSNRSRPSPPVKMSLPLPPWNQLSPSSPKNRSAAAPPIAPSIPLSVSVYAAPRGGVAIAAQVDRHRAAAGAVEHKVDAGTAVELVAACATIEQIAAGVAVERVVAAQATHQIVARQGGDGVGAGGAGEHVVVVRGRMRGREGAFGRTDVGQARGGQRPDGAELVPGQGRQRVAAAERRVGHVVAQHHHAVRPEQAAAGVGVEGGEDGAGGDVLPVAGDVAADVAAEDVVAVARRDGAVDVGVDKGTSGCVAGHDAVGQFHVACYGASYGAITAVISCDGAVADGERAVASWRTTRCHHTPHCLLLCCRQ